MRQDQYERLQALAEELTDTAIVHLDPKNWTANGTPPKDMTQQERGDWYWCAKQGNAILTVLIRMGTLTSLAQRQSSGETTPGTAAVGDDVGLLDAEVAAAEKEARKLMDRLQHEREKG